MGYKYQAEFTAKQLGLARYALTVLEMDTRLNSRYSEAKRATDLQDIEDVRCALHNLKLVDDD